MTETWEEVGMFDLAIVTPPEPPGTPPMSDVREVFDFWVETLRTSNRGKRPVLSDARIKKIRQALKDYGVETCKNAILGCSVSDFHMGRNGTSKKYDDIELILRDAKHIENFERLYLEGE